MTKNPPAPPPRHIRVGAPSPWIVRFAPLARPRGAMLDLACGNGRHGRLFIERGHEVTLIDRNTDAIADLRFAPNAEVIEIDLETEAPWPLGGRQFDTIIVTNYLYRPHFDTLLGAVAPGGLFLYETFARGNEAFTRPRNPDHLLKSGELLEKIFGRFQVIAYEHGVDEQSPTPGVVQRICAVNDLAQSERDDGEPAPHALYPATPKGDAG